MLFIYFKWKVKLDRQRIFFVFAAVLAGSLHALAGWCSGGGPGWFIECWNTGCTITYEDSNGNWIAENVDRSYGDSLCDLQPTP